MNKQKYYVNPVEVIKGVEKMSFIIKCNKCGSEQEYTNETKRFTDNIGIDVDLKGTFMGDCVNSIDIYCENRECNNLIELKY